MANQVDDCSAAVYRLARAAELVGHEVESTTDLTAAEAAKVLQVVEAQP